VKENAYVNIYNKWFGMSRTFLGWEQFRHGEELWKCELKRHIEHLAAGEVNGDGKACPSTHPRPLRRRGLFAETCQLGYKE
jgi:uncharacterized protein (DUF2249 family)